MVDSNDEPLWNETAEADSGGGSSLTFTMPDTPVTLTATVSYGGSETATASLTMGEHTCCIRAEVQDPVHGVVSATVVFAAEEWEHTGSAATISVDVTTEGATTAVVTGSAFEVTATATYETWDVWTSNLGRTDSRYSGSGPAIGAELAFWVCAGDGTITTVDAVTGSNGQATTIFTMGQDDACVRATVNYATAEAYGELDFSAEPWQFVSAEEASYIELAENTQFMGPGYGLLRATLRHATWQIWSQSNGVTRERSSSEGPAIGVSVSFEVVMGAGWMQDSSVTTGIAGIADTTAYTAEYPEALTVAATGGFTSGPASAFLDIVINDSAPSCPGCTTLDCPGSGCGCGGAGGCVPLPPSCPCGATWCQGQACGCGGTGSCTNMTCACEVDGCPGANCDCGSTGSCDPDDDGDGYSNAIEIAAGSTPNNAASTPGNPNALPNPEFTLVWDAPGANASYRRWTKIEQDPAQPPEVIYRSRIFASGSQEESITAATALNDLRSLALGMMPPLNHDSYRQPLGPISLHHKGSTAGVFINGSIDDYDLWWLSPGASYDEVNEWHHSTRVRLLAVDAAGAPVNLPAGCKLPCLIVRRNYTYAHSQAQGQPAGTEFLGVANVEIPEGSATSGVFAISPPSLNAQNTSAAISLLPVDLAVDADRDGLVTFGSDSTSSGKPFRFWVNDDHDHGVDTEDLAGDPNWDDGMINGSRDLEDFTVLKIRIGSLRQMLTEQNGKIGFRWKDTSGGSPSCRIFTGSPTLVKAADYLSTPDGAETVRAQNNLFGRNTLVSGGSAAWLRSSLLTETSSDEITLLMEGCADGKGKLTLVFELNGQTVDGPSLDVQLLRVGEMYDRGRITVDAPGIPNPWDNVNPPALTWAPDTAAGSPKVDPNAKAKTIIWVHGWRMDYAEYASWGDTSFKRLWQMGFKGRFYAFRWPTFSGENDGLPSMQNITALDLYRDGGQTYNASEYRAWLSGPALAAFVEQTANSGSRYLFAHSMGNVVSGAAMISGMSVTKYAMCNAAMASMAYDGVHNDFADNDYDTVDTDPTPLAAAFWGLSNRFNPTGKTTIANFALEADEAMDLWRLNNKWFKPYNFILWGYGYDRWASHPYDKLWHGNLGGISFKRYLTTSAEAFGYCVQARARAAGAKLNVGNMSSTVDMSTFGFGSEHSSEWNRSYQNSYGFWKELMKKFEEDVSNR